MDPRVFLLGVSSTYPTFSDKISITGAGRRAYTMNEREAHMLDGLYGWDGPQNINLAEPS